MVRGAPSMRTWLPWVGLALVAALAVTYVVVMYGGLQDRQSEPFEASDPSASSKCLTLPTLQRYTNASIYMEQALKIVLSVYDYYAKDAADQPIPGEEMDDEQPSMPEGEDNETSGFGGAQMDGVSTGGLGGEFSTSTTDTDVEMPSTPSFEGFTNAKAKCIRNPKTLRWAQTQYKERPLALLKVYNELRTRVNKGIEGMERIHKMNEKSKAQEKKRVQQTKAIQQAGVAHEASLNNYYDQGGSA